MQDKMNDVYVSKHAYERMRERMKLDKKASKRIAHLVKNRGVTSNNTSGRLRSFIMRAESQNQQGEIELLCYGEYVYVFNKDKNLLVTVYAVPQELKKCCLAVQRRERRCV